MYFTLTPPYRGQIRNLQILSDSLQKNVLIITGTDTEGLNHDNLHDLTNQIEKTILSNACIELIVIDITGDPDLVDNPDSPITARQLRQHLLTLKPTVIVTEDYNYWYKPSDGVIFFPWQLWLYNTQSISKFYTYKNTVYDTSLEKTQAVVCMNRSLHWHRLYLFSLLAGQSWFDKINYSFIATLGNRLDHPYAIKRYLDTDEIQAIADLGHRLPMQLQEEQHLALKQIPVMFSTGGASVNDPAHSNYAVNLVTETSLTEGVVITEKTCKAIMAYQIPIIVGPVGACQYLEDLGLDMFSDHVPWKTWDHEKDHKLRMRMIVEFLDRMLDKDTAKQDILHLHASLHPRLIQNKKYFHSREFENLLLTAIKSYTI